jgi:hypothetical protein
MTSRSRLWVTNVPLGARFTALYRASTSTNKAAVALLERSPQGHALAELHTTARLYARSCACAAAGACARKAKGIQAGLGAALSPAPLPAERQRELPSSQISVPIHAMLSPMLMRMEEERQDSSAEPLNGHASAAPAGHRADIGGTDSVEQGQGDVAGAPASNTREGCYGYGERSDGSTRAYS